MPFLDVQTRAVKQLFPDISAQTFWGDNILLSLVELAPNAPIPAHSHPHEQAGVVLAGELTLTIGAETKTLQVGEMYIAPGDVEHSGHAGPNGCTALDIFSPVRKDYQY